MQLYSQFPVHRTRQIVADVTALAGIALSIVLSVVVARAILALAGFGREIEGAGRNLRESLGNAADSLSGIPLVGARAQDTLLDASTVGETLAQAGRDQQELVAATSIVVGIVLAALPIAIIARYWLVRRMRFARAAVETRNVARMPGGPDLLALRALGTRPSAELLKLSADPVGAWRRGDTDVVEALAALEMRGSGIRTR
jgi:hypothetical protein